MLRPLFTAVLALLAAACSSSGRGYTIDSIREDGRTLDGIKRANEHGSATGGWVVAPRFQELWFPDHRDKGNAVGRRLDGTWVHVEVPSGDETEIEGQAIWRTRGRRFGITYDGQAPTMTVTLLAPTGRPGVTLHDVWPRGEYEKKDEAPDFLEAPAFQAVAGLPEGWVVRRVRPSGERFDVVYNAAGQPTSPELEDVRWHHALASPNGSSDSSMELVPAIALDDEDRSGAMWPIVLDGDELLKVPADCIGAWPLFWDIERDRRVGTEPFLPRAKIGKAWLVGWSVGWSTPEGIRFALIAEPDPTATELLLSSTGAIFSDFQRPRTGHTYHVNQRFYQRDRWVRRTYAADHIEYVGRLAESGRWMTLGHPGNRWPHLRPTLIQLQADTEAELRRLQDQRFAAVHRRAADAYLAFVAAEERKRREAEEAERRRREETTEFEATYNGLVAAGDLAGARDLVRRRTDRQAREDRARRIARQEARWRAREAERAAEYAAERAEYEATQRKYRERWERWSERTQVEALRGERSFYWTIER